MSVTTEQLGQLFLFSPLQTDDLESLKAYVNVHAYRQKEVVFHEGDRLPSKLYVVLDGRLLVQKISASGKETVLRQLPVGEMFAAPALFGDSIATATVIALQKSKIITVDKAALLGTIQSTPEVALQILSCFNQRLQEMHQTIHGLVSERAVIRLLRLIQYTAGRYGVETVEKGACLNAKLPYQQMARMVGITYEECVRLVTQKLKPAIIYDRGGTITIRDISILETLIAEYEC